MRIRANICFKPFNDILVEKHQSTLRIYCKLIFVLSAVCSKKQNQLINYTTNCMFVYVQRSRFSSKKVCTMVTHCKKTKTIFVIFLWLEKSQKFYQKSKKIYKNLMKNNLNKSTLIRVKFFENTKNLYILEKKTFF